MKRINSLTAIIMGTVLIFGACQQEVEPEAPTLVSPEDGAVSDTVPPTFVWNTHPDTSGLTLYIFTDTSSVFNEHIQDTAYALSQEFYDSLAEGTYRWKVVLFKDHWIIESEPRSFTIDRPEEQGLDLDTTYFPLGLGYKWCYERHDWGFSLYQPEYEWDRYDTVNVIVVDSFWIEDTLFFSLEESFRDIRNPIRIWNNKICLGFYWWQYEPFVPNVIDTSYNDENYAVGFTVSFTGDTMNNHTWEEQYWGPGTPETKGRTSSASRLKTIGPIIQKETGWSVYCTVLEESWTKEYSLLNFTTPQGQVYP